MTLAKFFRVGLPVAAGALFLTSLYLGLFWAPPEREMGEVYRLIYVHVPAVWMALLAATLNFACCIGYLTTSRWGADALAEASAEMAVLFGTYGVILGAIWGRPTWGVYWTWDPRLTSAAVMLVAYMGYLAVRKFVDDAEKRATWSAAVGIFAFIDIPIVWFSVRWWKGLHQIQSTPKTVDPPMVFTLRFAAIALLLVMISFLIHRYAIARARQNAELREPDDAGSSRAGLTPTRREAT